MQFVRWMIGGLIGGAAGAAIWIAVVNATAYEGGWIAWGVAIALLDTLSCGGDYEKSDWAVQDCAKLVACETEPQPPWGDGIETCLDYLASLERYDLSAYQTQCMYTCLVKHCRYPSESMCYCNCSGNAALRDC